jgi:hypothetical protein
MNKLTSVIGLVMISAAPLLAGTHPQVPLQGLDENLTPQQSLERSVNWDLATIANPGNGGKMRDAQLAKSAATVALVNDQAALESYKTAGPKMAIPRLEQAVRDDQYAVANPVTGSKIAYRLQANAEAAKKLAQDQASLDAVRLE